MSFNPNLSAAGDEELLAFLGVRPDCWKCSKILLNLEIWRVNMSAYGGPDQSAVTAAAVHAAEQNMRTYPNGCLGFNHPQAIADLAIFSTHACVSPHRDEYFNPTPLDQ